MVKAYAFIRICGGQGSLNADMRRCRNYTRIRYGVRNPIMWKFPPTCPREMNAWDITGDGQVFALTGAYNFDTNDFWKISCVTLNWGSLITRRGMSVPLYPKPDRQELDL